MDIAIAIIISLQLVQLATIMLHQYLVGALQTPRKKLVIPSNQNPIIVNMCVGVVAAPLSKIIGCVTRACRCSSAFN